MKGMLAALIVLCGLFACNGGYHNPGPINETLVENEADANPAIMNDHGNTVSDIVS